MEGRRETEEEFIAKWGAQVPFTICNWFGQGCKVHTKNVCDTVLHVYEPVYKPVVQRYHLLKFFFLKN